MEKLIKDAVEHYQCTGCINGNDTSCYVKSSFGFSCSKHYPGTFISNVGTIFLGMPKGFNHCGDVKRTKIMIFHEVGLCGGGGGDDGYDYDYLNIPVWKYKDSRGNTLVRGMSPRIDRTCIHN